MRSALSSALIRQVESRSVGQDSLLRNSVLAGAGQDARSRRGDPGKDAGVTQRLRAAGFGVAGSAGRMKTARMTRKKPRQNVRQ